MMFSTNTKCNARRVIWAAFFVLVCSFGVFWYLVKRTERDARRLEQDSLQLKPGESSLQEVLAVAHDSQRLSEGFEPCLAGLDCIGTVAINNSWLRRLHLAPDTGFGVRFGIFDSKLSGRILDMITFYKGLDLHAFVSDEQASSDKPPFLIRPYAGQGLGVIMTPAAPPDLRILAYDFNFHCLSKIGGCKTFEEMLPILGRKDLTGPDPWGQYKQLDPLRLKSSDH